MKLYHTSAGILVESGSQHFLLQADWDAFINNDNIYEDTLARIDGLESRSRDEILASTDLLPPLSSQELWGTGVTYYRSRSARMEEAKDAGGGDFYDRVYYAERPEVFFKNTPHRVVGHHQPVRIRKDSNWNVPEPELTLAVTSSGKIIGYTIGNDMSSRDIEGENPLYLPQAKTYDGSAAVGPCIWITKAPIPPKTNIQLVIRRQGANVFTGNTQISQIKRQFSELVEFLFRETSFPKGCLLMTGTGIIPPDDFSLASGDEIHITIEPIGTLSNMVA